MEDLTGRTALVTGASRGIGAAVARALADRGVNLGLASRSGDDLGIPDAVAMPTDVRDLAALEEHSPRQPPLVSVASTSWSSMPESVPTGRSSTSPAEDLEEMIDVNVKGAIYAARAVLPFLLEVGCRRPGHARPVRLVAAVCPWRRCTARRSSPRSG